jgi:aryl-alcohol dehydrogenase-like predicted oxidoreductase
VKYRPLGRTGLTVSELSLGTASLGVDYGIAAPGAFGRPSEHEAIDLVRAAVDRGITLIDTAPAYGDAERIVGRAVGRDARAIIATKTRPSPSAASGQYGASGFSRTIIPNLESSLRALDRDIVDILQIHNATREMIDDRATTSALVEAKNRGLVRALGATVYDQAAGLAVIRSGEYDVLQVAFNALDQRMMREVIPAADAAGVAVVVRSAFLKGVLTPKAQWLPDALVALRESAGRARDALAGGSWDRLPQAAMRFCLSARHVASVLTGARTLEELDAALAAEAAGPLDAATMARAAALAMEDEQLLDPSHWPVA